MALVIEWKKGPSDLLRGKLGLGNYKSGQNWEESFSKSGSSGIPKDHSLDQGKAGGTKNHSVKGSKRKDSPAPFSKTQTQ